MREIDGSENTPGIIARDYLTLLENNGFLRNNIKLNFNELETKLAGIYKYDDISGTIDICTKKQINKNDEISIWTDGSIVKEENAVAGIGLIGINQNNEIIFVASASLSSRERRMEIFDIETFGTLIGLKISKNINVKNIYCDNIGVIQQLSPAFKSKPHQINLLWVKGHANNEFNNMADGLAKNGRHIAKKENIINNKPIHMNYISGKTHTRTGWEEVKVLKSVQQNVIFKEDVIEMINNSEDKIKNIYIWERTYPSNNGISSQYIIAHADDDNNILSLRRGIVNNPNKKSGRFLTTEFILSRMPKNKNNYNLHLSNFLSDRYRTNILCKDKKNAFKFSKESFKNKIKNIGYKNIILEASITNNNFSKLMNNAIISTKEILPEIMRKTIYYINNNEMINKVNKNEKKLALPSMV